LQSVLDVNDDGQDSYTLAAPLPFAKSGEMFSRQNVIKSKLQ
jgi:hypothetical protein